MKLKQNVTKKELVSVFKIYILGWLCYYIAAILTLTLNFHLNFIIDIENWCQNLCVLTMYGFMMVIVKYLNGKEPMNNKYTTKTA